MRTLRTLTPAVALGALGLAACSGDSTGPGAQGQVNLSLAAQPRTTASGRVAAFDVSSPTPGTFTDGTNTIVLTKVQLVLRKIELKRTDASESACAASAPATPAPRVIALDQAGTDGSSSGSGNDSSHDAAEDSGHDGHEDACEEVRLGPVLLDVPVATLGAQQSLSVSLDAGTYDEVKFQIHKPEGTADQAFLQANPGFDGVSIRVEGTFNGQAFTYLSGLTGELELPLAPPITLAQNGTTDLTLMVDVSQWFANGSGGLLDPASGNAGQANESVVQQNIQRSFHAFEDANEDGKDDHGNG
jgi:hypothetical protein